jgi:uncharacterized membrane protein YkvA (DUF1232 family)
MAEFFSFLKVFVTCGTVFFVVMLVLLSLPQSRLRCAGLEMAKWALACGLLLLLPSPIDVVPDVVPVLGWADDLAYVVGALGAVKGALNERKKRAYLEAVDMQKRVYFDELEMKHLQAIAEENGIRTNDDDATEVSSSSNRSEV